MFFPQSIPEIILIKPRRFNDARGYFCETYRESSYREHGVTAAFVQDNHSLSDAPFVLRGLHFQIGASAQAKLIRCTRGAIFDVAVDLRQGSPTFGAHVTAELTEQNGHQLYVPTGFAHGFCTLTANCEVQYKVSTYYDPANDRGLAWDDPSIGIEWPLQGNPPILSGKDTTHPLLSDLPAYFQYDGA
ncbi:dTDP-4-dehydrorhamnose 3,5-epimerase [Hyphomonas sp. WL0036]|uniref:dTDP-4-dehydrorhamnose 3,5-epimerase n=1 Tax=Hyphomonas sediminis TaxID=2866160 RepID=UPI001C8272F1|nr:dTDP-4-dehydrorhamnose 3,5-epimerase [Hyphomonas sediminis]MBY9068556.1 dTDP-4-dehydrorhamnose 3,5-epimerase [Hyphomonas sediminis]